MKLKKFLAYICVIALCASCLWTLSACNNQPEKEGPWAVNSALAPANGVWRDYEAEAKLNYYDADGNLDPDMDRMGLWWVEWDDDDADLHWVCADSDEGASMVDVNKPTAIFVHGVLITMTHTGPEGYWVSEKKMPPSDFGIEDRDEINMLDVWLKAGYNVGVFSYHRFANESSFELWAAGSPALIESKVWGINGDAGMRYRKGNDTWSKKNAYDFSIAELFVGEYMRGLKRLPARLGEKEIQIVGHSMGGEVVTAGTFLITQMILAGRLPERLRPSRLSLLDAYFGVMAENDAGKLLLNMSKPDTIIKWSGKTFIDGSPGKTMLACLDAISRYGTVIEYYSYPSSALMNGSLNVQQQVRALCVYVELVLRYITDSELEWHNGVREYYMMSIMPDMKPTLLDGGYAPCASMPTEQILALKGKQFEPVGGKNTMSTSVFTPVMSDDVYVERR